MNEPCNVCLAVPLPNGKPCICGDTGTVEGEAVGLRKKIHSMDLQIGVWREYAELLGKEIGELLPFGIMKGWKSSRVQKGWDLRRKLDLPENAGDAAEKRVDVVKPVDAAKEAFDSITAEERAYVTARWCRGCWDAGPGCVCMRDE